MRLAQEERTLTPGPGMQGQQGVKIGARPSLGAESGGGQVKI